MKRCDKVYQALLKRWTNASSEEILSNSGSSAADIAEMLNITRANSSSDLNHLVKVGRIVKIKQYPVRFIPVEILQHQHIPIPHDFVTDSLSKNTIHHASDPFDQIIGSRQSLRKAVKQAKAAIMYPPAGLDMLLLGPTGSGKTFFSNVIYQYAKYKQTISDTAPFISFNCADYYNNAQLLLSQLFGYVRGAYTGADKDQPGLVEKADGGVLLLDEVHRLPPEGQEMLFTFMDTGRFSRLGETGHSRHATVLIIAATNEAPKSNLLETFLRRIPTIITIPSLSEKGIREQVQIVNYLFRNEAARIQRDLDVNISVIESLLFNKNYGNIGQLKSQIQLICAQAFLNSINDDGDVFINSSSLPEDLQSLSTRQQPHQLAEQLSTFVPQHSVYSFDSNQTLPVVEDNIYHDIAKQVEQLKRRGLDENQIQQAVMQELHQHVKDFLKEPAETVKLQNFVAPKVLSLTEKLRSIAETTLKEKFDQRFLYYIGMHIDTYLNKKNRTTHILMPDEITRIKQDYQQEYAVAQRFGQEIANVEAIELPDIEIIYLTLLLSSLRQMPSEKKQQVGILVLAHGTGTASSMVAVANELLGLSNVEALDMPLSVPPTDMLDQMVTKLTHLDRGKGVLLLVDMGSLAHLQEQIEKACSIPVKVIPFVTTLVVLDTVRKANYLDMDLNGLYNSVKNDYIETINTSLRSNDSTLPKAILSICMTGSGTAERLKTIIVNIINKTTSEPIVVRTVSALQLDKFIPKLSKQYNIIATVGTKQTSLKTPHITLESLIAGDGESVLKSTITSQAIPTQKPTLNDDNVVMSNICLDILQNSLIYLNPYLMTTNLIKWMNDLGLALGVHFSNSMMVKTIVHTSFAFERAQTHESIQYPNKFPDALQPKLNAVTSTLSPYEHQLKITIPTDELQFITEIINEESDEKVPTR